jgi:mannose/fructose/N-acetylgalactosamine-specific phosphotransferase system component IIB
MSGLAYNILGPYFPNNGGAALLEQDNIDKVIDINVASCDIEDFVSSINALPTFTISEVESVFFRATQINGNQTVKYVAVFHCIGKGTYGVGGTQVAETDVKILTKSIVSTGDNIIVERLEALAQNQTVFTLSQNPSEVLLVFEQGGLSHDHTIAGPNITLDYAAPLGLIVTVVYVLNTASTNQIVAKTIEATENGQTVFVLPENPENVHLVFEQAGLSFDYNYNNGLITLVSSDPTFNGVLMGTQITTVYSKACSFNNKVVTEVVEATADDQTIFNLQQNPNDLIMVFEQGGLSLENNYNNGVITLTSTDPNFNGVLNGTQITAVYNISGGNSVSSSIMAIESSTAFTNEDGNTEISIPINAIIINAYVQKNSSPHEKQDYFLNHDVANDRVFVIGEILPDEELIVIVA